MRLQDDPYLRQGADPALLRQLDNLWRQLAAQVNGLTEGRIAAVHSAMVAAPTAGEYVQGDMVRNIAPSGATPVLGWVCVASGNPGAWVAVTVGGGGGGGVASIVEGDAIDVDATDPANPIVSVSDSGVTPGAYTSADITVDAKGRVTAASNGSGGGGLVLIGEVVTSSSQAVVTFSSIPSSYRNLELRILGRGTAAATDVEGRIRFNGDTGANYDAVRENRFGSTNLPGASYMSGFSLPAASAPAGTAASIRIGIPNYKGASFHKGVEAFSVMKTAASAAGMFMQYGGGFWRNTAAINRIDIALSAGNWADGSVVSLYGMG